MNVIDAIKLSRSYRRFYQKESIDRESLEKMIDSARFSPSSRNIQPIKYSISNEARLNEEIFATLGWAGYLQDWPGPIEGERPSAYIIQVHDTTIAPNYSCDQGITAQSILLTAVEMGFGGCIIASVNRERLRQILSLDERYSIINVIALGKPKEKVVIEDMVDNNYKYYRDENGIHHVPKRRLSELILENNS
jgi:nitroreductase